jgi:hypothetical protein
MKKMVPDNTAKLLVIVMVRTQRHVFTGLALAEMRQINASDTTHGSNIYYCVTVVGRDRAVGIATSYGLAVREANPGGR